MLSSIDGMFDTARGSMGGCNGYLVKPLESSHLRAVLDIFFDRRDTAAPKAVPGARRVEDQAVLAAGRSAKTPVQSDFAESVAAPRSRMIGEADSRFPAFAASKDQVPIATPVRQEFPKTVSAPLQDRSKLATGP